MLQEVLRPKNFEKLSRCLRPTQINEISLLWDESERRADENIWDLCEKGISEHAAPAMEPLERLNNDLKGFIDALGQQAIASVKESGGETTATDDGQTLGRLIKGSRNLSSAFYKLFRFNFDPKLNSVPEVNPDPDTQLAVEINHMTAVIVGLERIIRTNGEITADRVIAELPNLLSWYSNSKT
jgi:hypothetical protein